MLCPPQPLPPPPPLHMAGTSAAGGGFSRLSSTSEGVEPSMEGGDQPREEETEEGKKQAKAKQSGTRGSS